MEAYLMAWRRRIFTQIFFSLPKFQLLLGCVSFEFPAFQDREVFGENFEAHDPPPFSEDLHLE